MIKYIELGGQERPVCFDNSLAYEYELTTGNYYEHDLRALFREIAMAAASIGTDNTDVAVGQMSIVKFVDFLHCALRLGYRKTQLPIEFDAYNVADWLLNDGKAVARFTTLLLEANTDPNSVPPDESGDIESAKKKTAPKPKRR